jgi:hypothetical protein
MGVLIDSKQFELGATVLALYNRWSVSQSVGLLDGLLVNGSIIALVVCHCQDV